MKAFWRTGWHEMPLFGIYRSWVKQLTAFLSHLKINSQKLSGRGLFVPGTFWYMIISVWITQSSGGLSQCIFLHFNKL